ncbi:unnamed protein product [Brassica oleracea var. botrytis]|uniref:(rape) hypothetical protein n=1 Tax=Brassica napus TaxID=3708 RepID=A0A816N726_BRANA|nr:unnamed protein product [Brassica napus]
MWIMVPIETQRIISWPRFVFSKIFIICVEKMRLEIFQILSLLNKKKCLLQLVMVVLKGSIEIVFGGNKEAAAYAEIVSMGGITKQVKRQLISTVGSILHTHFSIHPSRFIFKVFDINSLPLPSKL